MYYVWIKVSILSIYIAAIIGIYRYRIMMVKFHPVIWLFCVAVLNETLNAIFNWKSIPNAINSNIYFLIESAMLLLFFRRLGLFERRRWLFYFLGSVYIGVWIANNFIFGSIHQFCSYFIVVSSFSYVLMSITMINRLILSRVKTLIRDSVFLFTIGFVIFFSIELLVEIFWIYGLNSTIDFQRNIFDIVTFFNFIINLLFAAAVIWIPRKQEYTLL